MPFISVADLADGAADAPPLDEDGRLADPVFLVDVQRESPSDVVDKARARAERCDRILIGVSRNGPSPLSAALDLTLTGAGNGRECVPVADPEQEAHRLASTVGRNPQASLVLRQLLRGTATLPVPAALEMESYAYSTLLAGPEFHRWLESRRPRESTVDDPVLVRRTADDLHITLNCPERRNAYGRQLRDALCDALRIAVFDATVQHVVLDGAGPAFCAGGDLAEFGTAPDLVTAHFVRTAAGAGRLVHALAERLEVRVHGSCVGAGVELPALAAKVTSAADATFRLPEIGMGLVPGAGGTVGIPRRIGRWRTLYLALSGQPLPAVTALEWGLVDGLTEG